MSENTISHTEERLRLLAVVGLLLAGLLVLAWRAVDLQVLDSGFLQREGAARHLRVVEIPAHRGNIVDRNGEPLAVSTPVDSIWVQPREVMQARERWGQLAEVLGVDAAEMGAFIEARQNRQFIYLRRQVSPAVAEAVMGLEMPGVNSQREYRRYYPAGEVAAQLVGLTDIDDAGIGGLELAYEQWLEGRPGKKRVIKDRHGHVVEDVERLEAPQPGREVRLTLDRRLQYLAYRELKTAVTRHNAVGGSAVILDARTAEVLAMVNQPSFNPNNRGNASSDRQRNRAVTDVLEPGSAIKPFTVAAALESGSFRPDTLIDTGPGQFRVGGTTVRDIRNYGEIDVTRALQVSSNIGASQMALETPPEQFWQILANAGFGAGTGSGFPGEVSGYLSPYFQWGQLERATLGFGYGVAVTPLQLAHAYTAFANDGRLRPVSFVIDDRSRERPGEPVMTDRVRHQVLEMMEQVVHPRGTGIRAAIPGYRVAGKTGTVRKPIPGGYAEDRYTAIFAGMVPAGDPRLVMVVTIDEPRGESYYGGQVAAPVFSRVMGGAVRLLNIPPDAEIPEVRPLDSGQIAWIGEEP